VRFRHTQCSQPASTKNHHKRDYAVSELKPRASL